MYHYCNDQTRPEAEGLTYLHAGRLFFSVSASGISKVKQRFFGTGTSLRSEAPLTADHEPVSLTGYTTS